MVEHSKGFRTGRLVSVGTKGSIQTGEGANVPYLGLELQSEIPIGFGSVVQEKTIVLLIGDAVVSWWETMLPSPKIGDTVKVSYATMYVRDGVLVMRVQDPSLLELVPQKEAEKAPGMDTYQRINATDYFRAYYAEKREREENKNYGNV